MSTSLDQQVAFARRMAAAMHNPHFCRALNAWGEMRRRTDDRLLPQEGWALDAEYCLDRTEAQ